MNYIEFDKEKLVNITFAKERELLRCSRTGAFANTSLLRLNTRRRTKSTMSGTCWSPT